MEEKSLGMRLREFRETAGISQIELALHTNLSQQSISLWEKDLRIPNVQACIALADYYGISLDELVGRN